MTLLELLRQLWPLKRSLVSDGYDEALRIISERFPVQVSCYPSGTECWTWIVPKKWTCREAYLETLDGVKLIDFEDHPLHCVDYSAPVEKVVCREELFAHLHVDERNPGAIPYIFKFYEREWGLCCTRNLKDSLNQERYKVVIRTEFTDGELKVGEWWLDGSKDGVFVILAHLCHPYMANDDLSGIVVGLEIMKRLGQRDDRQHSFLLLIVPETIGTVAWLSHNEDVIPRIKGGLFLEMLGVNSPHALQRSYQGDTQVDRCLEHVLFRRDPNGYVRGFREIVRNDELEFNSPSLRIPVLSLSRAHKPESDSWPFAEYHTHLDTPVIISEEKLKESVDLAHEMVVTFDRNCYPKARFKGQVFCSRYGLFPRDAESYDRFFNVMFELDGEKSIVDICGKYNLSFDEVYEVVRSLIAHDLVKLV